MNRGPKFWGVAAAALLIGGGVYLWAVRGKAMLLDLSWIGCF
jgi:hypothetical protein